MFAIITFWSHYSAVILAYIGYYYLFSIFVSTLTWKRQYRIVPLRHAHEKWKPLRKNSCTPKNSYCLNTNFLLRLESWSANEFLVLVFSFCISKRSATFSLFLSLFIYFTWEAVCLYLLIFIYLFIRLFGYRALLVWAPILVFCF